MLEERMLEQERILKEREMEWKESPANILKLWGDALQNAVSRMPVEPMDIVSCFQCLEKLFEQLKVPVELYAVLMRPYLSDKAKFLLSRLDLEKSTDYGTVKRYILQEMQLTPSVYLDKCQSVSRGSTETSHQFANKLSSLFDYYVKSRKVGSYEELMELIVYDRIKASLPPFLSRHVLALESNSTLLEKGGWLGKHAWVEALDAYTAAMAPPSTGNKALGANSGGGVKPYHKSPKPAPRMYYQRQQNPGELPQTGQKPDALNRGPIRETPKSAPVRRCFIRRSPDHIALNCPKQTAARQYRLGSSTPRAASNACILRK